MHIHKHDTTASWCTCSEEGAVRDTAALLSGAVVGALQSCGIINPFTAMLSACPAAGAFGAAAGAAATQRLSVTGCPAWLLLSQW